MKKYLFLIVMRDTRADEWCTFLQPADDEAEARKLAEIDYRDGDAEDGDIYKYDVCLLVGEYQPDGSVMPPDGVDWKQ